MQLNSNLKSEALALLFGALIILINFGDAHTSSQIGNLDTIFGLGLWPLMDTIFLVSPIIIFLAYGKAKANGKLKFTAKTTLPLIIYASALFSISIDDFSQILNPSLALPETYWIIMMWLYPIISLLAFFSFGEANKNAR
jgi:hypothetical protein